MKTFPDVPALATAGNNIIFDHIIETAVWRDHLNLLISELDVFFVSLHCSLPELERREALRGNRNKGEALRDLKTVHSITSYDLELNSEDSLDDNVKLLIQAWKERKHPSALNKMLEEMKFQNVKTKSIRKDPKQVWTQNKEAHF